MSKRPRRNHSPAFKAKVALAALNGEKTLAELVQQYDVHPNLINQWRARLLEDAADVFGAELRRHGLRISTSGKGNRYDKATVETFFKTIKCELVWRTVFYTLDEPAHDIAPLHRRLLQPRPVPLSARLHQPRAVRTPRHAEQTPLHLSRASPW